MDQEAAVDNEDGIIKRKRALHHHEEQQEQERTPSRILEPRTIGSSTTTTSSSSLLHHSSNKLQSNGSVRLKSTSSMIQQPQDQQEQSEETPTTPLFGFVQGDFLSGKIHEVCVNEEESKNTCCWAMEYCNSHNLLAVGLFLKEDDGGGVALYETFSYSLVCTLPRHDSVSCLQWLTLDNNNNNTVLLLLAVGGFDGVVTLYHLELEMLEASQGAMGASILHEFRVKGQVRAMTCSSLLSTVATAKQQQQDDDKTRRILLTVGDKSGTLSLCTLVLDHDEHGVSLLSKPDTMEYSFDDGILGMAITPSMSHLAVATKSGKVVVRRIEYDTEKKNNSATVSLSTKAVYSVQRLGPVRSVIFTTTTQRNYKQQPCLMIFGGYDKTVVVVDTRLWAITRQLKVQGTINVLSLDARERYLAVGARDKTFVLFDTSSWCPLKMIHTPGWVTSISWRGTTSNSNDDEQHENVVAVRSEPTCVSILDLTPIHMTDFEMSSFNNNDAEMSSTSWTKSGCFVARSKGNLIIIADGRKNGLFRDVASFDTVGHVRSLAFCTANKNDMNSMLAVVNTAGNLFVLSLIVGKEEESSVSLEVMHSTFVEEHLWVVAWSADGKILVTGGRGKVLHFFSTSSFKIHRNPIQLGGRIWGIEFIPQSAIESVGKKAWMSASMAVATGDYLATLYDGTTYLATLQVKRSRTVRCVRYHPYLPLIAIGDGSNHVAIINYLEEETVQDFNVGGRVNCLEFSADGNFLVIGTDDCRFSIHETISYKAVQEIRTAGFATSASFSPTGEFLVLVCAGGAYKIVRMGPLLGTELIPLTPTSELSTLPPWALNEALYRSGDGPSLVQRYMLDGSPESVRLVAALLKKNPDALYTFDRTTGEGCFDTALSLQKPNLLKLTLTLLVDGTLEAETNNGGKRSILTTDLPDRGAEALHNMTFNQPQLIHDILESMTFIKVPFTQPHEFSRNDVHEMASPSYVDPWYKDDSSSDIIEKLDLDDLDIMKKKRRKGQLFRTPAVLPLPGLGNMKFLGALIDNTPPSVFDNDAMGLVLRVMWYSHLRRWFLLEFVVFVTFYGLWIAFVDRTASTTARPSGGMETSERAIAGTLLVLNTVFGFMEAVESARSGRRAAYLRSPWNIVDLLCILLVYSYIFSTIALGGAGSGLVPLVVFATLFLTIKLLAYLRGFGDTGWLISVLRNNMWDVRGFVIILACCLFGFALAFRVLFGDIQGLCIDEECTVDPFGSYARSLMSTFELTVLGEYDPAILTQSQFRILSGIIFVLAVMCVLVVALNALIAVLSDSYAKVQERAVANRRRERAELIFQYLCMLPKSQRKKIEEKTRYFHALLESDEDGDLMVNQDDWQGGLNALRRELQQDQLEMNEANQRALEQMRTEVNTNIAGLQKQMTSMLEDLSHEIKEMKEIQSRKGLAKNVARAVKFAK